MDAGADQKGDFRGTCVIHEIPFIPAAKNGDRRYVLTAPTEEALLAGCDKVLSLGGFVMDAHDHNHCGARGDAWYSNIVTLRAKAAEESRGGKIMTNPQRGPLNGWAWADGRGPKANAAPSNEVESAAERGVKLTDEQRFSAYCAIKDAMDMDDCTLDPSSEANRALDRIIEIVGDASRKAAGGATLVDMAWQARMHAHAPYSGFKVGAAIRAGDGSVHFGCNVENAAYPQGSCAEAGAISAMVASGQTEIVEVAVVAESPEPVPPCGGCRQRLSEFAAGGTLVIMANSDETKTMRMDELLPAAFGADSLETKRRMR